MGISLPLLLVYIAVFGVAFLYFGSLWSSLYCGVSLLWVGLYRWLVKVSWLGKLVVGVLVGGAFSMEACVGILVGGFFLSGVQ